MDCLICRGPVVAPLNLCATPHEAYCTTCWSEYVQSIVSGAFLGTCPCVLCPSTTHAQHAKEAGSTARASPRAIVPFVRWREVVPPPTSAQYTRLAQSVLAFRCSSCHEQRSLDVGFSAAAQDQLRATHGAAVAEAWDALLPAFLCGAQSVEDVYAELMRLAEMAAPAPAPAQMDVADANEEDDVVHEEEEEEEEDVVHEEEVEAEEDVVHEEEEEENRAHEENSTDEENEEENRAHEENSTDEEDEDTEREDARLWRFFATVLRTIDNPERRVNLHLRYLRAWPFFHTRCCSCAHCFNCNTEGFHRGKSCVDKLDSLGDASATVLPCPSCGVALARGDGCNIFVCVCGKEFSWHTEVANRADRAAFAARFPEHTHAECAHVLCDRLEDMDMEDVGTLRRQARAWKKQYATEVDAAMRAWIHSRFPMYTTQCVFVALRDMRTSQREEQPEFVRALQQFSTDRRWEAEMRMRIAQMEIARDELFLALAPRGSAQSDIDARAAFARSIVAAAPLDALQAKTSDARRLRASAERWIEKNKTTYVQSARRIEVRRAQQFLHVFGECNAWSLRAIMGGGTTSSISSCASSLAWNCSQSSAGLQFAHSNTFVGTRGTPRLSSSVPRASASLVADRCMLYINLRRAMSAAAPTNPRCSDVLSFGLASGGDMNPTSRVGLTAHSWGFAHDGTIAGAEEVGQTTVFAGGDAVASCRRITCDDVLSAVVDVVEGWVEVALNESEFVHRFVIPPRRKEDYQFALTVGPDFTACITHAAEEALLLYTVPQANPFMTLSVDQLRSFHPFRLRTAKLMITDADDDDDANAHNDLFPVPDVSAADDDDDVALAPSSLRALLLGDTDHAAAAAATATPPPPVTWNAIVALAGRQRARRRAQREAEQLDMAFAYMAAYGADAPFVAAMELCDFYQSVKTPSKAAALAFMQVFASDMDAWYVQDRTSSDPLLPGVRGECTCLPRHFTQHVCPCAR